MLPLAVSNF